MSIEEMLLERRPSDDCPFKTHCYCDIDPPHGDLFNRDGPEAADEITRLKALIDGMEAEHDQTLQTLAFLWKWVERGMFDPKTEPVTAIEVLAFYPSAPWQRGRWDVDHKPYAEQFYAKFPKARALANRAPSHD